MPGEMFQRDEFPDVLNAQGKKEEPVGLLDPSMRPDYGEFEDKSSEPHIPVPPVGEYEKMDVAELGIDELESFDPSKVSRREKTEDPIMSYTIRAGELIEAYQNYRKEAQPSDSLYAKLREAALDMISRRFELFKNQEMYRLANNIMRNQYSIGRNPVDATYLEEMVPEDKFHEELLSPKDPADQEVLKMIKFFEGERAKRMSRDKGSKTAA